MKKVKDILRKLMLLYKRFLYFLAKLIEKRDDKMVVFESFQGRNISCNPKALYEEMKNNPKYKDYTLVWSLRNPNRTDVKNAVKFESFGYYRALAKAKYWIFNSNPRMFLKPKADQIFVQTWHGTPLKKIGLDVEKQGNALTNKSQMKNIYVEESKKITYMISPSKYCTDKFISAFNMKNVSKENNVLTTGYPRNDYLF
ncbi:MAG: CDP-glycerol glycerophosphotransferase family protein [Eubacterium sp.]